MYFRSVALVAALFTCAISFARQPEDEALKKLLRALGSQRDVEATLIQVRRYVDLKARIRVQIVPKKGIRVTVLMPVANIGIVSFDDGNLYKLYDPENDHVLVEKSPEKYKFDIPSRKRLIEKNYDVRFEPDSVVAKRKVKVVYMEGLFKGVIDRRLHIDAENDMILRYELLREGEKPFALTDTLHVDLWVHQDPDFTQAGPKDIEEVVSKPPSKISSLAFAERYVDFKPAMPNTLPAGLERQAIHVVHHKQTQFLAIRLSDGMAFVTVYMYKSLEDKEPIDKDDLPLDGQMHTEAEDGLRFWVVGDADEAFRIRLAKLFVQAYNRTID